jgi:hypothetical protein
MGNPKPFCAVAAVVFGVVALAHLARAVTALPVTVDDWQVPMALSWLATAFAGALSAWGVSLARRG